MLAKLEARFHDLYLEYFHKAEAHRRWNLLNDIPWEKAATNPDPDVVKVVQAYMAVEMFLPDYTSKLLHLVRSSRGRAWFQANWGYEESKHSLALEMWLMKSGAKTEEEVREFQDDILASEWRLPYDTPLEMILYTCFQEFATSLNYRGLKRLEQSANDPALQQVLTLLSRDETGHFEFFKNGAKLFIEQDRARVLDGLNVVIKSFQMPAQALIPGWKENDQLIRKLGIFDDRIYMRDVVRPVLKALGISSVELRDARHRLDGDDAPPPLTGG